MVLIFTINNNLSNLINQKTNKKRNNNGIIQQIKVNLVNPGIFGKKLLFNQVEIIQILKRMKIPING